mmetsp:Transcript_28880/g.47111  ORF Transcript_28880/g.47111 Transcript_28880/m.47111 type:complete len:643 (-) Transcript_28880:73-2001(-)
MALGQLALVRAARPKVFLPLLVGLLYQLYRWWLQRSRDRRRSSIAPACVAAAVKSKSHVAGCSGPSASSNLVPTPCRGSAAGSSSSSAWHAVEQPERLHRPPPRPGVDDDTRFHQLEDDPRYFQGAELGKAQVAALGQTGLAGHNTVSFDPNSTLVRPWMRVVQGTAAEFLGKDLTQDDIVVVPELFCLEENLSPHESLVREISDFVASDSAELDDLPYCFQVVDFMRRYLAFTHDVVHVIWYRQGGDPWVLEAGADKALDSSNCTAVMTFGAPCELVFQMADEQPMHMACINGMLLGIAGDVSRRWREQKLGAVATAAKGGYAAGQIIVRLVGTSQACPGAEAGLQEGVPDGRPTKRLMRQVPHGDAGNLGFAITRLPRPSLRFITVRPSAFYGQEVRHDDVISVPDFYCAANDWDVYYDLLKEMRQSQAQGDRRSEWVSWHEGSHLLTKAPESSPTFRRILDEIRAYFSLVRNNDDGTRFNWYRDGSDWKPFHHDSAAFNVQRASTQNCSIGISFGASRELAFRHAKTGELLYVPQTNGMLFFFGKDVNIRWQHGINALPKEEQSGKGRISIVLWGLCTLSVDEEGSPPMLEDRSPNTGRTASGGNHRSSGVCRNFQQRGFCSYGDRCRYAHVGARNRRS